MQLGNWQLDSLNGGTFRIDGGIMFGVVPKTIWQGVAKPDDRNRILCANRCILGRDGTHTVLIDTGYGGKHGPLERRFFAMETGEPLLTDLLRFGVAPEEIDTVVFSHLHFDHVGGATRYDHRSRLVATFPKARHVVGRWEWQDATQGSKELQTAYTRDDIAPLADARLCPIDDGDAIVPGLRAVLTGGHTRGHLALLFESGGQSAICLNDICPSTAHLKRMWHLAYDTYPLDTRRQKPLLLGQAADCGSWILWNHDPAVAASRVARDARCEYRVIDSRGVL